MSVKTNTELDAQSQNLYTIANLSKFVVMSAIGIFIFFIPITLNGKSTIPVDHITTWLQAVSLVGCQIFILITFVYGSVLPFINKTWNRNAISLVFTFLKITGTIVGFMTFFKVAPAVLLKPDMLPFIFNKVALPVGLIVPIGAVLLMFLTGYGLMEFFGVLMRPIMRPVYKVPGLGALNAVTSFVGSFSVGMLLTNKLYKEGRYNRKEAIIILTGFSTVSATFMVIVAKTLGLMSIWNTFFWSTLVICFLVSAITVRFRPLKSYPETYYNGIEGQPEKESTGNLFMNAINEGLKQAQNSPKILQNITINFLDGLKMSAGFLPVIMSVGIVCYCIAKMTPVFDYLAYICYPFALLVQLPDAFLVAKAATIAVVDMFLPAVLAAGAGPDVSLAAKYVIGVVSISGILFLDGTIPIIVATDVEMKLKDMFIIYFERAFLIIILAGLFTKIIF